MSISLVIGETQVKSQQDNTTHTPGQLKFKGCGTPGILYIAGRNMKCCYFRKKNIKMLNILHMTQ